MAGEKKDRAATAPDDGTIGHEEARTLGGLFRLRVQRTPEAPAYRHYAAHTQAWQVWTWRDMAAYVARFQDALRALDLEPGDRIAIMLPNGPDWVAADQAALGLSLVVVPLHLDHQPSTVAYVLAHSGARVLLLQDATAWRRLEAAADALDGLDRVVVMDGPVPAKDPRLVERDRWLPSSASRLAARDNDPDALATIIYPPGGARPRGVMLSHRNLLWNAWACTRINRAGPGDVALSFLPLAHSLERTAGYYQAMLQGVEVAFSRSPGKLLEDMAALRPTVMLCVPRIFERIFARLTQEAAERGRGSMALWDAAQRIGYSRFERRQGRAGWRPSHLAWPVLERLVARRVRAVFGGRLRFTVSSGAPLSPRIARLFLGCGVDLRQAYALTEAGPMVSCNPGDANEPASVGVALPGVRVRMQQNGELLVNSPGIMQGYWKDPQATRKVIDETGWLHTGDRVAGLERKRLYLSGRFKGIVVMSTGEKVAPMELEKAMLAEPVIGQVLALGEGRPYMAALVVLDPSLRADYLKDLGLDPGDPRACASEALEADLLGRIMERLRDFPRYAQVRRVAVMPQPWTVENGFLTPTRRIRRRRVLDQHAETVTRLYEGHAGVQLTTLARNVRVAG